MLNLTIHAFVRYKFVKVFLQHLLEYVLSDRRWSRDDQILIVSTCCAVVCFSHVVCLE